MDRGIDTEVLQFLGSIVLIDRGHIFSKIMGNWTTSHSHDCLVIEASVNGKVGIAGQVVDMRSETIETNTRRSWAYLSYGIIAR